MSKKWRIAAAVLFVLAALLAIAIPVLLPPTPGVTYANFSRIEKGMTQEEVERLLGKPIESKVKKRFPLERERAVFVPAVEQKQGGTTIYWESQASDQVEIEFDHAGLVATTYWNSWLDERRPLEKLRDRVPWLAKEPPSILIEISETEHECAGKRGSRSPRCS
jgi:hypothetical protein